MGKRIELDDDGNEVEVDDGIAEETEVEDRGDNLEVESDDDELEVDESVVAALAKDDGKDNGMIPRSRYNDLKARLDALEASVATPVAPTVTPPEPEPEFDIDAKEQEYADAITEGDTELAKTIRKEIRQFERESLKAELRNETKVERTIGEIESRKAEIITQAFTDFPQLDHSKKDVYDAALVGKINLMQTAYESKGLTADVALQSAIKDFLGEPPVKKDEPAADRAKEGKQRNAKAANGQPPPLGGVGTGERARADQANVENMTEAEFAALPEREKKRLRGD
jgi:hypothetical protein